MGMSTESGMLRGAGVGAVSGAVFSIEAVESCIEIWRSSESGKYSILFVVSMKDSSNLFSFMYQERWRIIFMYLPKYTPLYDVDWCKHGLCMVEDCPMGSDLFSSSFS